MNIKHSEIQQLMRQMVDLGIADNLKLWTHSGLVKTRTSGSDLYVPKAYDISGNENDAAQTTEANQPKLVSGGIEFNSTSSVAISSYAYMSTDLSKQYTVTYCFWARVFNTSQRSFYISAPSGRPINYTLYGDDIYIDYQSDTKTIRFRNYGRVTNDQFSNITVDTTDFLFITCLFNGSQKQIFINGTNRGSVNNSVYISFNFCALGGWGVSNDWLLKGVMNDVRIFDIALTSTQISAIYNATKSKYGH